jgi:hypothetical protein
MCIALLIAAGWLALCAITTVSWSRFWAHLKYLDEDEARYDREQFERLWGVSEHPS